MLKAYRQEKGDEMHSLPGVNDVQGFARVAAGRALSKKAPSKQGQREYGG